MVATADDLLTLNRLVREAGEEPEAVGIERIVLEDDWRGAVELE